MEICGGHVTPWELSHKEIWIEKGGMQDTKEHLDEIWKSRRCFQAYIPAKLWVASLLFLSGTTSLASSWTCTGKKVYIWLSSAACDIFPQLALPLLLGARFVSFNEFSFHCCSSRPTCKNTMIHWWHGNRLQVDHAQDAADINSWSQNWVHLKNSWLLQTKLQDLIAEENGHR